MTAYTAVAHSGYQITKEYGGRYYNSSSENKAEVKASNSELVVRYIDRSDNDTQKLMILIFARVKDVKGRKKCSVRNYKNYLPVALAI